MDSLVGAAFVAALMFAVLVWRRARNHRAGEAERASRPKGLANARLHYAEKLFRARHPIPLTARLDRGYLDADGSIVLVELKTRWKDRAYLTDVIQLSAQKMAVEAQTGQRVAAYGYVTVKALTKAGAFRSHKVELMPAREVVALHRRREDVLAGRVLPRYAQSPKACSECPFRARCDRSRA